MQEIKEYKPIALIYYINGAGERDAIPIPNDKVKELQNVIEKSKMIKIEWTVINTFEIKEIKPYERLSEVEMMFRTIEPKARNKILLKIKRYIQNSEMRGYKKYSTASLLETLSTMKQGENMMQRRINNYYE